MPVAYTKEPKETSTNMEEGRLVTFQGSGWPHPADSRCSALNMAKAGFYYYGTKDLVKCFVCNIKLQDWAPEEDDPWQKHAANCLFAKLGKSEGELTVEQWIDVFCNKSLNLLDSKISKLVNQ